MPNTYIHFMTPNSNQKFYFLFDNETNLPSTIPMDLATFLVYLRNTYQLSGFVHWYQTEIKQNKTNSSFDLEIPEDKQRFMVEQVNDCDSIQIAEALKDEIEASYAYLETEGISDADLIIFSEEKLPKAVFEFRAPKYYSSLKDLYCQVSRIDEEGDEEGDDLPF